VQKNIMVVVCGSQRIRGRATGMHNDRTAAPASPFERAFIFRASSLIRHTSSTNQRRFLPNASSARRTAGRRGVVFVVVVDIVDVVAAVQQFFQLNSCPPRPANSAKTSCNRVQLILFIFGWGKLN